MKNYKDMTRTELGAAYDNTSAVLNSSEILAIYEEKSQAIRNSHTFINIKYGEKERQNIDYFPVEEGAPLFVFIHGGYWQMRQKETFHFLLEFIEKHKLNVAFIGYTLAPQNTIAGIKEEVSTALKTLRDKVDSLHFNKDKIVISGWSAGGHLSAEMLGEEGVISALAISGIYDLEPISMCILNDKLNLSEKDIQNLSPIKKVAPTKPIHLIYGQAELAEIIRQSKEYHAHCKNSTLKEIEKANHFSILLKEETFKVLEKI